MPRDDIGFLLNRATRHFRLRLAERLGDTGLTPPQAAALMALARSEHGYLTPREIATAIDADPATTSGVLERLTRDGWLVAEANPDDGRSRLLRLTEQATQALPALHRTMAHVSAEETACLTAEETETLAALLRRLGELGDGGQR